jgi:hypothetical protein
MYISTIRRVLSRIWSTAKRLQVRDCYNLLMYTSTIRSPLSRIWGTAKRLQIFGFLYNTFNLLINLFKLLFVPLHPIYFVINLFMYTSTIRRSLSRICGTAKRLQIRDCYICLSLLINHSSFFLLSVVRYLSCKFKCCLQA